MPFASAIYGGTQLSVGLQASGADGGVGGKRALSRRVLAPPPLLLSYRRIVAPVVTGLLERGEGEAKVLPLPRRALCRRC